MGNHSGPAHRESDLYIGLDQTALNPPSRFKTQLFAYSFCARKTAASAISLGLPNR